MSNPSEFPPPPPPAPAKPWYLRWWAITIASVFAFTVFVGAVTDTEETAQADDDTTESESPESRSQETEEEPEETEEPEPELDFFETEFADFESVTESGSGEDIIDLPEGQGAITASHSGSSNFVISVLDDTNEQVDLAVNHIGAYEGTTAYGLDRRDDGASLQIRADGSWEITIEPFHEMAELDDPHESEGDSVYKYDGEAGAWDIEHSGDSNFVIHYYSSSGSSRNLLVNEIGAYSGIIPITSGPALVVLGADGSWSIETN